MGQVCAGAGAAAGTGWGQSRAEQTLSEDLLYSLFSTLHSHLERFLVSLPPWRENVFFFQTIIYGYTFKRLLKVLALDIQNQAFGPQEIFVKQAGFCKSEGSWFSRLLSLWFKKWLLRNVVALFVLTVFYPLLRHQPQPQIQF